MTTIETLTLEQVHALETEAAQAGDAATVADCRTVSDAYTESTESELRAMIDAERGEVREAARRIVEAISNAEAQEPYTATLGDGEVTVDPSIDRRFNTSQYDR